MRKRLVPGTILLVCLWLLAGCGSDSDSGSPDPTPAAMPPTATPQPTEVPLTVDDIVWTSGVDEASGEPLDDIEGYTTVSPAIVAVVPAENVPAGTEFTATWMIDGLEVPDATISVTVDQDMDNAWIAFEFIRHEGRYFPLGTLEVTVTTSSGESVDGSVSIGLP